MMGISVDLSLKELITNPITGWFVSVLLLIWIIRDLIKNWPLFLKVKAKILMPLVQRFHFLKFEKEAIRSDIQGTINYAVAPIIEELPSGSLKPVVIEYVNKADVESFIKEGKIFIRIRPAANEDENILNVSLIYLELALIPDSKNLLSKEQRKSISYFTTQKIIEGRKSLINKLHDEYYLPDISRFPRIKEYFEKISRIDRHGLFYSLMIRILERGASNYRFKSGSLTTEFDNILEHLIRFISNLKRKEKDESIWKFTSPGIAFSILLVAKPIKAIFVKPSSYVNRLKDDLKITSWIFVVFSRAEGRYGSRVARAIEESGIVDLVDTIKSKRDYRGKRDGIVKLYVKKEKLRSY